ncbi:MAG: hypothetical protein WDO19_16855 [Bacteroidota bacterium]
MIKGSEKFGYAPFIHKNLPTDFLPDNDVAFYTLPEEQLNYIILAPGEFILFSRQIFINRSCILMRLPM